MKIQVSQAFYLQVLSLQTHKVFMCMKKLWKASVWRSIDRHCVNSNICIKFLVSGDESLHFPWLLILRYPVQTDISANERYDFCCHSGYLLSHLKMQSSVVQHSTVVAYRQTRYIGTGCRQSSAYQHRMIEWEMVHKVG